MQNAAGIEMRTRHDLVEAIASALRTGESWLVTRIMDQARRHAHPWPVSATELGWPLSARLLSATLVERLREIEDDPSGEPGSVSAGVTDFIQSLSFCRRGERLTLVLFLELVKIYRRTFLDLFRHGFFDDEMRLEAVFLTGEAFDELEAGVCREWSHAEGDERRRAWQAVNRRLVVEKRRYEAVFVHLSQPAFIFRPDGRLEDVNRAGLVFLEDEEIFDHEEGLIRAVPRTSPGQEFAPDEGGLDVFRGLAWLARDVREFARDGDSARRLERAMESRDGSRTFAVTLLAVEGEAKPGGVALILEEVTEASRKELALESALRERDVLLREVHHRVKNNMQIISSLISLQAQQTVSEEAAAAFLKSQLRIRAMAAAHESMYRSEGNDKICLGRYLRDILCMVAQVFKKQPPVVQIVNDIEGAYVDMDTAVPCGLIVGELAANSFKHAFKGKSEGMIRVSLTRNGSRHVLIVEDDGDGIPPEALEAGSLGLELVRALVEQLYGRLTISSEGGARFAIEFSAPLGEEGDDPSGGETAEASAC